VLPVGPPTAGTSWRKIIERTQLWIRDCTTQHTSRDSGDETQLPQRVLDVSLGCQPTSPPFIRLCEPKGEKGRYITLSHRWRAHQPLMTTSENLERHLNAIPLADLADSFLEAVAFTQRLGIRYLWIDSLCNIQDDTQDWHRAASQMASIY
jgi:hypothetical protein